MFSIHAELLDNRLCELAEGPMWDELDHTLWWLDIKRGHVLARPDGGQTKLMWDLAQNIGCMAFRERGGLILGLTSGVYLLSDDGATYRRLPEPVPHPRTRFNDGKCDPRGRFWAGTINLFPDEAGIASLYCVLPDNRAREVLHGVTNSNGLAFTEDGGTLYYIDTPTRRVDTFDVSERADGFPQLTNRHTAFHIPEGLGWPDGMNVDREGTLWIALWGSGIVGRFDPLTGELMGQVNIPVRAASNCCFAGDDFKTLVITSAREGMLPGEETLAGSLFCAYIPVAGMPVHRFRG